MGNSAWRDGKSGGCVEGEGIMKTLYIKNPTARNLSERNNWFIKLARDLHLHNILYESALILTLFY
ncbi:hypothetical protein HanRHA438_Chr14g0679801 [Helianthus annuus]|nr:hypothetical protein HanRHA438_Chr14g0679801 [Helianthus annuus]